MAKTNAQLDREIRAALASRARRRGHGRQHSTTLEAEREPTADELYMVAYDVLREYEGYKKLGQLKSQEAKEVAKRFNRIRKEVEQKHPGVTPPEQFTKLLDKVTKPEKTYAQAQRDLLDNLRANGWTVSAPLKIPHATSPNGELRLWFKPQAVWFTRGNRHNFKDARTISYDLDIRARDPDAFRAYMERWSEQRSDA